jgi:predicted transcriptional regulator
MRTTLTLDDTLAKELKRLAAEEGRSFKEVVNQALARGLRGEPRRPTQRFRQKTHSLGGVQEGVDLTKALQLAAVLEDEESARKLRLRK